MIELISIGAELLTGQTVNTNASFIAKSLLAEGYKVARVATVTDQRDALKKAILQAMKRSKVLIMTGGLGPTGDDITREVLAEIFEKQLIYDKAVALDLKKRYGEGLETLEDQATVIEGSTILRNSFGTAPGFILKKEKSIVFVLPGVPHQMQEMLRSYVIPHLLQEVPQEYFHHALYLSLISEQKVDPYLRELEQKYPGVEIGICPGYGTLSIYLLAYAPSKGKAIEFLKPILSELRAKFKDRIFSETDSRIEHAIHETFIAKNKTFACAESCTGGKIASRLTEISGSSDYFLGSLVTYSDGLKQSVLQVKRETLEAYGAVSKEVVIEMAEGTLALTGADFVIAVSGVAGPTGGTAEKPVGTVWGAIGQKGGAIYAAQFALKGNRDRLTVINYSATYLLCHMWRLVKQNIPPFED